MWPKQGVYPLKPCSDSRDLACKDVGTHGPQLPPAQRTEGAPGQRKTDNADLQLLASGVLLPSRQRRLEPEGESGGFQLARSPSVPVSPENPIGVQLEGRATLSDLVLPGVRLMNIEPDSSCSPHLPQLFHGAAGKGTCSGHSRAVLPREVWLTNHRHDLTSFL